MRSKFINLILVCSLVLAGIQFINAQDNDSDLLSGRNQYFKQDYVAACNQPVVLLNQAPTTPDEAARSEIVVNSPVGYKFKLDDNGNAFLQLAVTKWNEKLVIFHSKSVALTMKDADIVGSKIENLHCPMQSDKWVTHINTHEWGSYVLSMNGKPNQMVEVTIIRESNK
ncbi:MULTISPECIES: hypothetical protein [Vibrio]|uniref:hypothetical protein n=1 Tax=Vibrio TaxID=662 RepID=UPI000570FFF0|nr:hypothetical protein [Vibrio pacinii]